MSNNTANYDAPEYHDKHNDKHDAPPHYHLVTRTYNDLDDYDVVIDYESPCTNDCTRTDKLYVVPADDPDATVKHLVALLVDILTSDAYLDGRTRHQPAVDR